MNNECFINLKNISLQYDLHHDRTDNLKEAFVNFVTRKSYVKTKKDTLLALDDINISINHGERLGIVGFNGAGKSSLLKLISGIYKPTNGTLSIKGHIQPLIEIGAGFEQDFTGRENIFLNAYMLGFTKKQVLAKEKEIIDFSELADFIDTPIKYYSSGMIVRLAFTIATMIEPEILVFDEMLSAGDAAFIAKAQARMDHLLDKAKIMVLVSHDLEMIKKMCTRAILINSGKIMFDGEVSSCLEKYQEQIEIKKLKNLPY
jgi:ABC-type polysaccharide/polyol phosphate transport system ATPase subunit